MSRIILCGASSVGKTTISSDWCSRHTGYEQITEVARDVMKEREISREHLKDSLKTEEKKVYIDLQSLILEEQNKRETELGDKLFISDRGPDPIVYTHLENTERAVEMSKTQAATECFARYRQSLVVLVCPLEIATDDGFRIVPFREEQDQFTNTLRSMLIKFKIPFLYLGERNRELRIDILRKAVQGEVSLPAKSLIAFPCLSFYLNPLSPTETGVLRTILINPSEIQLRYSPVDTNRIVSCYGENYFVCVKFHSSLSSSLVRELLRQGLQVNGDMYQFLGCSYNGLSIRECYMLKGSVDDVDKLVSQYGEFSDIKMVSEQLRGISQLLTAGRDSGVEVSNDKIIQIEETSGILTHDGCGVIGLKLAEQIAVGANAKVAYPEDNIPSVLQVMFLGYKCVVSRQPSVDSNSIHVRKPTEKFGAGSRAFQTVWVCAHSRPNSYGTLSKEYIILLSGRGVSDEALMKLQEDYILGLEKMLTDSESARLILDWQDRPEIAALCKSSEDLNLATVQLPLKHVRNELILKLERLSIPLLHSRVLFGVCDPLGVLKDGECFIRVSIDGTPHTIEGQVIVGKKLCYHLGDIRKLTAVAVEQECLNHMVDCIVMKCPHSAVICDSDLCGEQYFVCWDKDVILIGEVGVAKDYNMVDNPPKLDVTREMLIDYFSEQENLSAQINEYFQIWADVNGPGCDECEKLGSMLPLSRTQNIKIGPKSKYKPPRGPLKPRLDRVWNKMQAVARSRRRLLMRGIVEEAIASSESAREISEGFIRTLLEEEDRVTSEYCLFKLIHEWCCVQDMPESEKVEILSDFSDRINFCAFTAGEKREAVEFGVPVDRVMNALYKSKLITKEMLLPLYLASTACGWKLSHRASGRDFDWNKLLEALTNFPESLLIIQLQDDVKLALNNVKLAFHFLEPLQEKEFGAIPTGSLSTCIYSTQIKSVLRHVTECEYNFKLSDDVFQVFQNLEICDTFIFMKRRYYDKKDNTEKHNIVSMDLNRFKGGVTKDHVRINKTSFSSVEIFVKTTNQTIVHLPSNSLPSLEVLEDVPSDEEQNVKEDEILDTIPIRVLAPDAALKDLKEFAEKGDSLQFSRIISSENEEVLQLIPPHKISDVFLALLSNLVAKISHRKPSEDISGYLKHILQSPLIKYQAPKDLLFLYSCLQKLHMNDIIQLRIEQELKNVKLDEATQYFECLLHWEWWTFLPVSVACQVLDKLHHKHSTLLPNKSKQPHDLPMQNTIESLASSNAMPPAIDGTHLELYRHYFAHLILKHLLVQSPGVEEYEGFVCTEHSICKLRAMHSQASPVSTDEVVSRGDKGEGELAEEKSEYFQVTFSRTDKFFPGNFIAGAYVKIRLLPTTHSEHSNAPIALGRITSVGCNSEGNRITVDVHDPVPDCVKRSAQLNVGHWGLTLVGDVSLFKSCISSLQQLHCSPDISPILISPAAFPPEVHNEEELVMDFRTDLLDKVLEHSSEILENPPVKIDKCSACRNRIAFNRSQGIAIATALNQRLTLIHGYPGSGKTAVASEIIHRMCHLHEQNGNKDFKILATAATDKAVDILTRELLALNLFVVRVGNLNLISPDIHEHTLDQHVETKRAHLKDAFQSDTLKQEICNSADIIATTCAEAGNRDLSGIKFSLIVIDDATQVIEPVSLIPIVKSCQKLVLIGDPKLLPPALPSTGSSLEHSSPSLNSLRVSLFHRLYKKTRPLLLEEQHRMHPHLAQFPARVFYSGRMSNGVTVNANKRPPPEFKFIFTHKPVVFIHVASEEIDSPVSITNPTEADGVVQIVKTLMSLGILSLKDIAVLTPYTGQVECVKERLGYALSINVDVSCIDDFQGKERNVIVFSTVRSNNQAELGLIGDPYRINLLLTRAKLTLIGIGNGDTLCSSQIWDEWLKRYDVISEEEFFKLTEGSDKFEKSYQSKNQYHRHHDDDDTASNYSCSSSRESEVGSEMSWDSDSEPALNSYPREGSEPPGATQGRKYPRDSELPESSNVSVTDSSNSIYEGDY